MVHAGVAMASVRRPVGGPVEATLADGTVITADEILVAAGRRPATADVGLDTVGLPPGRFVEVDDQLRAKGVAGDWLYAIGDCNGRALLTHMGKYQAASPPMSSSAMPTRPSPITPSCPGSPLPTPRSRAVGLTESQARERGPAGALRPLPDGGRGRRLGAR